MLDLRTAKTIDLSVQMVLAASTVAFNALGHSKAFFISAVLLAAWQILSMALHQLHRGLAHRETFRWWFHRAVLILLIAAAVPTIVVLLSDFWPMLIFGYLVLLSAPIMTIVYIVLCAVEFRHIRSDDSHQSGTPTR